MDWAGRPVVVPCDWTKRKDKNGPQLNQSQNLKRDFIIKEGFELSD